MPAEAPAEPYLVTLLPSTDVDLGRWLLHHYGAGYRERPHAPICHVLALKWHGCGPEDYPLLVVEGTRKLPMVDAILPYLEERAAPERRLLPEDPARRAQIIEAGRQYRYEMGGGVVSWAYFHFLPHRRLTWASFTTGVAWYEKLFVGLGYPLLRFLMTRALDLSEANAGKALTKVRAGFDEVDALLADGREFLHGDRLSYADLAFAAAGAPMVLARGYGGHLPPIEQVTPEMRAVMEEMRARPAGAFIQRLYDRYRLAG